MAHLIQQHKWETAFIILIILLGGGVLGASEYFYRMAFIPAPKSFLSQGKSAQQKRDEAWLKTVAQETWHETASGHQDWRLTAVYVPAETKTTKTVVVAHGYMNKKTDMAGYIRMFHQAGYNVLAPDDRAHGDSDGDVIGWGWADRKDYLKWLKQLLKRQGSQQQIALFGVSMGSATVAYLSGEQLPKQVFAIVADCGYTSVDAELSYQAKSMFNLPRWPLVPLVLRLAQWHTGVDYKNADALAALRRNKRPTLFIHGTKDTFVPTRMVHDNYAASAGEKELWLVKGAKHAMSQPDNPAEYSRRVMHFLNQHLPEKN